jgi:prophage maintenance system killer protein
MYKMLSLKDVIEINKEFGNGQIINEGSISYAISLTARSKNWLRTAALFTRSILIDHTFEDGNKRTAAAIIMLVMDINNVPYNPGKIPKIIVRILLKNITGITEIERCIKDAIRID